MISMTRVSATEHAKLLENFNCGIDLTGPSKVMNPAFYSKDGLGTALDDSLPLRCIKALIGDASMEDYILDNGVQFIAIRQDLWEQGGFALESGKIGIMESANSTKSKTLGIIPDLTIRIGDIILTVRAHVVPQGPFRVLLGRPFFVLTSCNSKDFRTGEQHITITDPEDSHSLTIPTHARQRYIDRSAVMNTGFGSASRT